MKNPGANDLLIYLKLFEDTFPLNLGQQIIKNILKICV